MTRGLRAPTGLLWLRLPFLLALLFFRHLVVLVVASHVSHLPSAATGKRAIDTKKVLAVSNLNLGRPESQAVLAQWLRSMMFMKESSFNNWERIMARTAETDHKYDPWAFDQPAERLVQPCRNAAKLRSLATGGALSGGLLGIFTLSSGIAAAIPLAFAAFLLYMRFQLHDIAETVARVIDSLRHRELPNEIERGMVISVVAHPLALNGKFLLAEVLDVSGDQGLVEIRSEPVMESVFVPHVERSFYLRRGDHAWYNLEEEEAALWAEADEEGNPIITW